MRMILLIADVFHPLYDLAVECFLKGNARHSCVGYRAVPVLLTRRKTDHITEPNDLDGTAPVLYQSVARRHDEGLAQRMRVPCWPSARLEGDTRADSACGVHAQHADPGFAIDYAHRCSRLVQALRLYKTGAITLKDDSKYFESNQADSRVEKARFNEAGFWFWCDEL